MKAVTPTRTYNTETSLLMKSVVKVEPLGDGYVRVSTCNIYYRSKDGEYFIHLNQVATDPTSKVIDVQDYFYPCADEFARKFDRSFDYMSLLKRPCYYHK